MGFVDLNVLQRIKYFPHLWSNIWSQCLLWIRTSKDISSDFTKGRDRKGDMPVPSLRSSRVMAKGAFEKLKEKWGMWDPLFSWQLLAVCYKILKIKLSTLGMDFQPISWLLFLQGASKGVAVSDVASFYLATFSSSPRWPAACPELTELHNNQLLHLLVAHFLPVVTELLRKGKLDTSYEPDAMG